MNAEQITRDLITKVSDDVVAAMLRTLAIAPTPSLPVAMGAAAAALGIVAAELALASQKDTGGTPDSETMLLAGLLSARMGMGGPDPIGEAYDDLRILTEVRAALAQGEKK